MEQLEQVEKYNILFSFYENLLTEKQQSYFKDYFHYDLSLAEISEQYGISRNAVHDQIKNVKTHLDNLEEKLKLYEKAKQREFLIDEFIRTKDIKYIEELRKVDE